MERIVAMGRVGLASLVLALAAPAWAQPPPVMPIPRTAFLMETLQTAAPGPEVIEKLKPLKTLREVEELLKANNLAFAWRRGEVETARLGPQLTEVLVKLPPKEVFVMPQKDGSLIIGVIIGQR